MKFRLVVAIPLGGAENKEIPSVYSAPVLSWDAAKKFPEEKGRVRICFSTVEKLDEERVFFSPQISRGAKSEVEWRCAENK